jgi:orotidine-5'-phosphate decarboxylase
MNKLRAFIALDAVSNKKNLAIVRKLKDHVYGFKVGYRSFYKKDNDDLIKEIKRTSKLFLDLKLNDIPNTVLQGLESLNNINPDYITLHISGGFKMLEEAKKYITLKKSNTTLLTSLDQKDIKLMFGNITTKQVLKNFAKIADRAKIDGLICSGQDLKIFNKYKKLLKITPGVCLYKREKDDQKRTISAIEAFKNGANYIVIGRELINHKNPINALQSYYEENKDKNLWTD